MKRKLSKKRALELCRDLWVWLAKHKKTQSEDWELKKIWLLKKGLQHKNSCPACEYAKDNYGHVWCENCPLLAAWNSNSDQSPCMSVSSPYWNWKESTGKRASEYATQIANAAKKELAKLHK